MIKNIRKYSPYFALFLLLTSLIAVIFTVLKFPIYPDEISVRSWLSRLPYDFPFINSNLPTCKSSFLQYAPISIYIPGTIDWIVHGVIATPLQLRIVGVLFMLCFLLWPIVLLARKGKENLLLSVAFPISILMIGTLPIFMSVNRGEQYILLSIMILFSILFISEKNVSNLKKILILIIYIIAISLALHSHPKALFLTPFFVLTAFGISWRLDSRKIFIFLMIFLIVHVYENYQLFSNAYSCKEHPEFESYMRSFSLHPPDIFIDPIKFFNSAYSSLVRFYVYPNHLLFLSEVETGYLPPIKIAPLLKLFNVLLGFQIIIIFIFPLYLIFNIIKYRKYSIINTTLISLCCTILVSGIFNIPKHWYDSAYLYLLSTLVIFVYVNNIYRSLANSIKFKLLVIYLCIISAASQIIFVSLYLQPFLNGFSGPGISVTSRKWNLESEKIRRAAEVCEINQINSKNVITDDFTYYYFTKSFAPMPATFILGNPTDYVANFLSSSQSDGLLVYCTAALDPYKNFVTQVGQYCCIKKSNLKLISTTLPDN